MGSASVRKESQGLRTGFMSSNLKAISKSIVTMRQTAVETGDFLREATQIVFYIRVRPDCNSA